MTSPATELRDLFANWTVEKGESIYSTRSDLAGGVGHDTIEFWEHVANGVDLVRRVHALIDQAEAAGREVSIYRKHLEAYYRGVFAPDIDWSAGGGPNGNMPSDGARDMLLALDQVAGQLVHGGFTEDKIDEIVRLLTEAEDLIPTTDVTEAEIRLILQIQQARLFAENISRFGAEAFTHLLFQTLDDAKAYASDKAEDDPTMSEHLTDVLQQIAIQAAGSTVGNTILQIASDPNVRAALLPGSG